MGSGGKGITADINITPLIDVVLVLLIIFMVITPMLQKGMPVDLPMGADPAKKPDSDDDVIVSIKYLGPEKHELYLKEEAMAEATLEKKLRDLYDRAPSTALFIKADRRLRYGDVKAAMLLCESTGFRSVSLVALAPQK